MRRPTHAKTLDLLPDAGQHLVGDLVVVHPVERRSVDHAIGHNHRCRSDLSDRFELRRCDTVGSGLQRCDRFVLDGPLEGGERPLVADALEPEHAGDPEHVVGCALLRCEHLHEEVRSIGGGREVGRGTSRIHSGSLERGEVPPATRQRLRDLDVVRLAVGGTEDEQDRRSHDEAERNRQELTGRRRLALQHTNGDERRDEAPAEPAPSRIQGRVEHRKRCCESGRVHQRRGTGRRRDALPNREF